MHEHYTKNHLILHPSTHLFINKIFISKNTCCSIYDVTNFLFVHIQGINVIVLNKSIKMHEVVVLKSK